MTGRHIAKPTVNDTPQQRAADAARWLRGELAIKPNVALAARIFGVSPLLVIAARERCERRQHAKRSNGGIATLSDYANLVLSRQSVEERRLVLGAPRLTQSELPPAAAE